MKKIFLIVLITLIFSCNINQDTIKENTNMPEKSELQDSSKHTIYFPFDTMIHETSFSIMAHIESPELYPIYSDLFEKYNYSGNGYCWEGHIIQILEEKNSELLNHIEFDSEAGGFFAYTDNKENQIKFVETLSPIFADMIVLEKYIKKVDRSRIDD